MELEWSLSVYGLPRESFSSCSDQFDDVKSIRLLHTFSSKEKPQVHLSCVWDGFYLCVSMGKEIWTVSEGRWKKVLKNMPENISEKTMKIWDMGPDTVFKTTQGEMFLRNDLNGEVTNIDMNSPIKSSYLVNNNFFILCDDGSIYLRPLDTPFPGNRQLLGWSVKAISCGSDHALLLEENTGRVWSMGRNLRGQLGHGDLKERSEPCIIEGLDGVKVIEISSGLWHNLVLSEFGDLYSWGWNEHGQLGQPCDAAKTMCIPCLIPMKDLEFCQVACGSRHSMALTNCGKLLSWGWNGYGQLGRAGVCGDGPAEVCMPEGISMSWIACGPWNAFVMGTSKIV